MTELLKDKGKFLKKKKKKATHNNALVYDSTYDSCLKLNLVILVKGKF